MKDGNGNVRWVLAFFGLLALSLGCAVRLPTGRHISSFTRGPDPAFAKPSGPAPKTTGPVVGGPRVDHVAHTDRGLDCVDCHEIDKASGEPTMPTLETCQGCHEDIDEEKPDEEKVSQVFFDPQESPRWRRAMPALSEDVRFPHASHTKDRKCSECHGTMATGEGRRAEPLFTMDSCMECHTKNGAPNRCETCHERLNTNVPPPSHDVAWLSRHGPLVRAGRGFDVANRCDMCHAEPQDCDACHQSVMPASHASGWLRLHGAFARAARPGLPNDCGFCHHDFNRCDACHQQEMPESHHRLWTQRHGPLARTAQPGQPGDCALCHHDPNFCERCHKVEEPRDHTTLFRTRTHGVMASIDRIRCQTCHETDFCQRCHEDTAPRSHRAMWAQGRSTHCVQCHFPISQNNGCRVCHRENPVHATAPVRPPSHFPGLNCRNCHNAVGGGGAPPLRHVDNGMNCEFCHR